MENSQKIMGLFARVREKEQSLFQVSGQSVRTASQLITNAYRGDKKWCRRKERKEVDFNDRALRCAYLHRHAMVHAGLVSEVLESACSVRGIHDLIAYKQPMRICSLGGGPGSEIVGLFLVIDGLVRRKLLAGRRAYDVTVVDVSRQWEGVFRQVVAELEGACPSLCLKGDYFRHRYLQADLLDWTAMNPGVRRAISEADAITMVKFVSAAASSETKSMVMKIFNLVRPGAFVIFIDSAAGGFWQTVERAASAYALVLLYSRDHHHYNEQSFNLRLCGLKSRSEARVCIRVWQKELAVNSRQPLADKMLNAHHVAVMPNYNNQKVFPSAVNNYGGVDKPMMFHSANMSYHKPMRFHSTNMPYHNEPIKTAVFESKKQPNSYDDELTRFPSAKLPDVNNFFNESKLFQSAEVRSFYGTVDQPTKSPNLPVSNHVTKKPEQFHSANLPKCNNNSTVSILSKLAYLPSNRGTLDKPAGIHSSKLPSQQNVLNKPKPCQTAKLSNDANVKNQQILHQSTYLPSSSNIVDKSTSRSTKQSKVSQVKSKQLAKLPVSVDEPPSRFQSGLINQNQNNLYGKPLANQSMSRNSQLHPKDKKANQDDASFSLCCGCSIM